MAQIRSDNIQVNAPKPIDNKWGVFSSGAWRPFNDLAEFDSLQPLVIQYETQMFWVRSTTDANKADLYALRKDKTKYKINSDVDFSNYYTKTQIDSQRAELEDEIEDEADTRLAQDTILSNSILGEIERATSAEGALSEVDDDLQQQIIDSQLKVSKTIVATEGQTSFDFSDELIGQYPRSILREGNAWTVNYKGDPLVPNDSQRYCGFNTDAGFISFQTGLSLGETVKVEYAATTGGEAIPVTLVSSTEFNVVKNEVDVLNTLIQKTDDNKFTITDEAGWIAAQSDEDGDVPFQFVELLTEVLNAGLINGNIIEYTDTNSLEFVDLEGFIGFGVDLEGYELESEADRNPVFESITAQNQLTIGGLVVVEDPYFDGIAVVDDDGFISTKITEKGFLEFDYSEIDLGGNSVPSIKQADINYYPVYGQSLSIGGSTVSSLVTSRTQPYNSLMFHGGIRYLGASGRYDSLDPMVNATTEETPAFGMAAMIVQAIQQEEGYAYNDPNWSYQVLSSCPGENGKTVAELSKGSVYYTHLIADVANGLSLANAQGKTFNIPAFIWIQGEQDITIGTNKETYKALLRQLRDDFNADVKALGYGNDVDFIMYQTASFNRVSSTKYTGITLAQYEMCVEETGFTLGTAMYMLDYQADMTHLINTSSLIMGVCLGYAAKQRAINSVTKNFVYPTEFNYQGKIIEIVFNTPSLPLTFDTTQVVNPGNYGFRVFDQNGTEVTITSVSIVRPDTVKIVLPSTVVTGYTITYAINGTGTDTGRTTGARGNLRDSQGLTVNYNYGGVTWNLNNWCPIFQKTI